MSGFQEFLHDIKNNKLYEKIYWKVSLVTGASFSHYIREVRDDCVVFVDFPEMNHPKDEKDVYNRTKRTVKVPRLLCVPIHHILSVQALGPEFSDIWQKAMAEPEGPKVGSTDAGPLNDYEPA